MAKHPGIHIFESTKLSLASNGMSGLRPLLVGRFYKHDGTAYNLADGILEIDDWLSFSDICLTSSLFIFVDKNGNPIQLNSHNNATVVTEKIAHRTRSKNHRRKFRQAQFKEEEGVKFNNGVLALRHYFDNGGGPCLLLSYEEKEKLNITEVLQEYDEISLMATIDADTDEHEKEINTELDKAISKNKQAFLVTCHANIETPKPVYGTNRIQTATYGPKLITGYGYSLDDTGILVNLEDNTQKSEPGTETKFVSLAQLRNESDKADICKKIKKVLEKINLPAKAKEPVILSPCAAVVGAYCRTERQFGIWKAPANVALIGAMPEKLVTEKEHGELNENGINAIIWDKKYGSLIMGARTLEDPNKTAWLYVPVRLLFNTVERDLRAMMAPVIFEPNSLATWQIVRNGIESYLYNLWKKGGLYGTSPEQAYAVNIGPEIMNEDDINNGVLRARIGLAALRPAEFIYLEFTQDVQNIMSA
ncbi:phage tail sheath family protein [Xenorhabdus szentirmaii]|uniref:phage tail sheath family protein n=1 Tax=Xenorhabdus szentirmaii TaxID=290112 RepID=UPI001984D5F7|nr:phage tail sheath C-terminal domain-containing protein [Xenorhabdus sp. 5]MBD2826600.1 phage tail sheath family protein [Xenorhabdus sp. 5]